MQRLFISILLLSVTYFGVAQERADLYLKTGLTNANNLLEAYLTPGLEGFGRTINTGWYNTARTHKSMGFSITLSAASTVLPSSELTFDPSSVQTNDIFFSENAVPTVGSPDGGVNMIYSGSFVADDGNTYTANERFFSPPGADLELIPTPMVQVGIGLFKATDIKIRYMFPFDYRDIEFDMLGVAVIHDLKQWFAPLRLSPFELSIMGGFTSMSASVGHTGIENSIGAKSEFSVSSIGGQLLFSKKLGNIFTPYFGLGYESFTTSYDLKGTYNVEVDVIDADETSKIVTYTNPFSMDVEGSGVKATVGFRFKLAFFTYHADYTYMNGSTFSTGIGVSFNEI